jgi:hypothetical protein
MESRRQRCGGSTARSFVRNGEDGTIVLQGAPVSVGSEGTITNAGDYRFFAGWRIDPFFFDVCSIALELPNANLGSSNVRLWGRTVDGTSGSWLQSDRGARASQEPFLSGDEQIAYITGEPANDARFIPVFAHGLQHADGYTPEAATQAAGTLLPDIMVFQPGLPASYPSNGRSLTDGAAAHFLSIFTNGKVTGDGLKPHTDLLADFPYVGPPH